MNDAFTHAPERLLDLLADRATEGLDQPEASELGALLLDHPHIDQDELDWVAATLDVALTSQHVEPLPERFRDRVLLGADAFFNDARTNSAKYHGDIEKPRHAPRGSRFAWYLAAASIVFALVGWWQVLLPAGSESQSAAFAKFLREADDVIQGSWKGEVAGYENVTGKFAWSGARQGGFMRFENLPPNDPKVAQYQLWIVDPDRDKHPIDGGVFNVGSDAEAIIAIDAKLQVDRPSVFAVTLEKPGGVVVSDGPLLVVGTAAG